MNYHNLYICVRLRGHGKSSRWYENMDSGLHTVKRDIKKSKRVVCSQDLVKKKSNETSFISVNSDLPYAKSSDSLSLPCHTPVEQEDAPFSKPFLPGLQRHPLSVALLLSSKVVSLASCCLSVPHSPLVIALTALSPRASERMHSPDFLLQPLPQGPRDRTPPPFPPHSLCSPRSLSVPQTHPACYCSGLLLFPRPGSFSPQISVRHALWSRSHLRHHLLRETRA